MKYIVEKKDGKPMYLKLYEQFRDDIVKGVYKYNSKLPSKRTVAQELSISTVTIEHTYSLLSEEGYIEAKERSGYYVIFKNSDGFSSFSKSEPLYTGLPADTTDDTNKFPMSVLAKTMRKVLSDYDELILKRSPNFGMNELRSAIRDYLLRSKGIDTDVSQIIIGSGAEYLYGLIVELLGRDLKYAIESPSYRKIEQIYSVSDVEYEKLTLRKDGIDSHELFSSKADVLHITPYRSFPSGVTASATKRHEYLRWAQFENRYIIEDDYESEFSISQKSVETVFSHTKRDNVIYVNTFSKTVSPSFRVGYMVLPKHLVPVFTDKLGFYSCTVPTFEQLVLAQLISNGDFERHINRVRRKKRKELG